MNVGAGYNQHKTQISFSLSVSGGNVAYVAQCIFFAVATISMYMMYCESNVLSFHSKNMDPFNLLWCCVGLLLLNETFFIPERFRNLCRTIACFLVWNNFEAAACSAKTFYTTVQVDTQTEFTGDSIRVLRAGMFGSMLSIVGSFLASYLLPNGRSQNSFTAIRFQQAMLQSIFYCVTVLFLCVATFVQWSRDDNCGSATFTNYNATLLFVSFWIIFGLVTNDCNTLDIALAILSSEIIKSRPTSFGDETKMIVVYSLLFSATIFFLIGAMLHSGLNVNGITVNGIAGRVASKTFALHVVSIVLGISGSACVFSRTKDKDALWTAFWAGWGSSILGLIAHLFDAECFIIPSLFFIPQAFDIYGASFVKAFGTTGYLQGYERAGTLLLLLVPLLSTLLFYTRNIQVQSFDQYLRADGAAPLKSALILMLASSLLWKTSAPSFWSVLFIASMIFSSSYNPRSALPKASLLLSVQSVTIAKLWLIANTTELTTLPAVILFIGLWMYIFAFTTFSADVWQNIQNIHDLIGEGDVEGTGAGTSLLGGGGGYTAVGDTNEDNNNNNNDNNTNDNSSSDKKNAAAEDDNNDNSAVLSAPSS